MLAILWSLLMVLAPPPADLDAPVEADTSVYAYAVLTDETSGDAAPTVMQLVADVKTGGGQSNHLFVTRAAGDEGQEREVVVRVADDHDGPKTWIGVRVTAIPAPLAAHIGEAGVMIANVVVDSPADAAGLEQYDVVTVFGDHEIVGAGDLTKAVRAVEPGQAVAVELIRGGERTVMELAPSERPTDVEWELKYEEPEDLFESEKLMLRGLKLNQGPGGNWVLKELGELQGLPEAFKSLEDLKMQLKVEVEQGQSDENEENLYRLFNPPGKFEWHAFDDSEEEVSVNFNIHRQEDDGSCIRLESEPDGAITVTREDADGQRTEHKYENAKTLREADIEAYKLYCKAGPRPQPHFVHVRPFGKEARKLRQEYQVQVEEALREAKEQAEQARVEVRQAQREARRAAREAMEAARAAEKEHRIKVQRERKARDEQAQERWTTRDGRSVVGVKTADNGQVTVYLRDKADAVQKYSFVDQAAFKAAEPELYEQVRSLLE